MKILITLLTILLLVPSAYAFDPWSKQDLALQATMIALHVVDWGTTLDIADNPDKYREINPILGDHPSRGDVNLYFISSLLVKIAITHVLPAEYRVYWQSGVIALQIGILANNFNIGLRLNY